MELQLVSKKEEDYLLNTISLPTGSGIDFFSSLRDKILDETNKIRDDINLIITKHGGETSKSKPKVDDYDDQFRLDRLGEARRINLDSLNVINELLRYDNFIICECGEMMLRTPENVSYKKIGNNFIIDKEEDKGIKYNYTCEKCHRFISEDIYMWQQGLKRQREELLDKGETWVPDNMNYWYHDLSRQQKPVIHDDGCNHVYKREINKYTLPSKTNPLKVNEFLTIKDKCIRCGEVVTIK